MMIDIYYFMIDHFMVINSMNDPDLFIHIASTLLHTSMMGCRENIAK